MKLIDIGFGNYTAPGRILSILSPDSSPIKRMIAEAREKGMLVDASFGRSTRSVILMDSNHLILSALLPSELYERIQIDQPQKGEAQDG